MVATKQKSFRLAPEEWEPLARVVGAGRADNETAAMRWVLAQVDGLLVEDGHESAGAELLAAKDAHIASLERELAKADERDARTARLLDQAQQLAAMAQHRLGEATEPKRAKKRKKK